MERKCREVGKRCGIPEIRRHLACAHTANHHADKLVGVCDRSEPSMDRILQARSETAALINIRRNESIACLRCRFECLNDKIFEVEHLDSFITQDLGKGIMLVLGLSEERNVIKEETVEV